MTRAVVTGLLCAWCAASAPSLQVDPAASSISLRGPTTISLAIQNHASEATASSIRLEWLDTQDTIRGSAVESVRIAPGESVIVLACPFPKEAGADAPWYRLRYRIHTDSGETGGLLTVAHDSGDAFELRVASPMAAVPGGKYRITVLAATPIGQRPVEGVRITERARGLSASAVSDVNGVATLEIALPPRLEGSWEPRIEGRLGDFTQSVTMTATIDRGLETRIDVDKPLYQPGQTLHMRFLCRDHARRAAADRSFNVSIADPRNAQSFATVLNTDRFGVASTDWTIPANQRLGEYRIQAGESSRTVRVSRYELPSFTVTAATDRPYYLPGQNATVEIHAQYLFGKPVPGASVRVVRENRRESSQGQADAAGTFRARLDLRSPQKELRGSGSRYLDTTYIAYVTDPSSGRTEEQRFDVRVTGEAIHLYVLPGSAFSHYVAAFYADGSPAFCRVQINGGNEISTNRYGLARLPADARSLDLVAEDGQGLRGHTSHTACRLTTSSVMTNKTIYRAGEAISATVQFPGGERAVVLDVSSDGRPLASRPVQLKGGAATVEIPWQKDFIGAVDLTVAGESNVSHTVLFPPPDGMKLAVHPGKSTYRPGEEATVSFVASSPEGKPLAAALGVAVVDAAIGARGTDHRFLWSVVMGLRPAEFREKAALVGQAILPADPLSAGPAAQRAAGFFDPVEPAESRPGQPAPLAPPKSTWMPDSEALPAIPREDLEHIDFARPIPADLDLLAEVLLATSATPGSRPGVRVNYSARFGDEAQRNFQMLVNQRVSYLTEALVRSRDRDWPRDDGSLARKLAENGVDEDAVRDPWGQPYRARFGIEGRYQSIEFLSAGPDRQFGTADDLTTPAVRHEWFAPYRHAIAEALRNRAAYPENEVELREALKRANIDLQQVTDPWGNTCRFRVIRERFSGVTRTRLEFRSPGPDHTLSTADDLRLFAASWDFFTPTRNRIARLLDAARDYPRTQAAWEALLQGAGLSNLMDPWGRELTVEFETSNHPVPGVELVRLRSPRHDLNVAVFYRLPGSPFLGEEDLGSVEGQVTDASGAVVPGAKVTLIAEPSSEKREIQSDGDGRFWFDAVVPGIYEVRIVMPGFRTFSERNVLVLPEEPTEVTARLDVGELTEVVTVEAAVSTIETISASVGSARTAHSETQRVKQPKVESEPEQGTPRVREYFPETLLWAPRLETGSDGRAQLNFRLADTITTWKLEAVASTEDGAIETAAVDIRAFQSFFVDHSLPPILTEGDEIQLPVAVRNYEEKEQPVDLTMHPAAWAELRGTPTRHLQVPAAQSASELFWLRAARPVDVGKLGIAVTGGSVSDAIERQVTVRPDRRQAVTAASGVLSDSFSFEVSLPDDMLGQPTAELKIYSNLLGHVVESIAGGMKRPYGCAEQTTSSTYPSLMLLRLLKHSGMASHPRSADAAQYLDEGLARLAGYRAWDGSYTYWGNGPSDVSLTAYVLRFLTEAKEFARVENSVIESANAWLAGRQAADGSWSAPRTGDGSSSRETASIALALVRAGAREPASKALRYLTERRPQDTYTTAAAALLALRLGDQTAAAPWLARLRSTVKRGASRAQWELEGETPFHGWGLPGQLEASALAVEALLMAGDSNDAALVEAGLAFLLDKKDGFGVWYSGHTTVQVLDAVLAAAGVAHPAEGRAQVVVNGRVVGPVELPAAGSIGGPVTIAIPTFLHAGVNRISLQNAGGAVMRAQIVATYFAPWTSGAPVDPSSPIRMRVDFDKTRLRLGESVTCKVEVSRRRGSGMLLAEIGLPPGVDVDRSSLEDARNQSKGLLNSFEVLPDRLIVYLWPPDRVSFSFRFQPRLRMSAKSAASQVYDYYNPEALNVVAPVGFRVE